MHPAQSSYRVYLGSETLYTRTGHLPLQLGAGFHNRQTTDGQNTNDMLLPISLSTGPASGCVLSPLLLTLMTLLPGATTLIW